ncbi:hypothetical protein K490DRAFT_32255 [Saccharata proteae CBS 121410]|uniref:RRM domain-containing protein n=1 Tax=Saccharata proteae CBS 121410 TaxID=1314787 RepID=A0A9P4M250_9PEZI|nr:hypothetical protein K490DRAFT_32255 [Saccharata proteae CBS 121410]
MSDTVEAADAVSETGSPDTKSRKRKRIVAPEDELEIDINAPVPPSKKELRKAKKGKTSKPSSESKSEDREDTEMAEAAGIKKEDDDKTKKPSEYGIWIGNLPWTATKDSLRSFIAEKADIKESQITRIHMPAPNAAASANQRIKPTNKGFAYVDLESVEALNSTIGISETLMGGRRVLVKNAKSFEGRPKKEQTAAPGTPAAVAASTGKEPSKRVFVGNLGFDVTKEDLIEHYKPCGEVVDVHMATFQDTGKCKGYAWVTFEELDAAAAAVAGFTWISRESDDSEDEAGSDTEADGDEAPADKKPKKAKKPQKWFVNRLQGRQLRTEFAEDATTRYKKRYGKDGSKHRSEQDGEANDDGGFGEVADEPQRSHGNDRNSRRAFARREVRKVDARQIRPGAALANAPRATAAIVQAEGKKITFE